ncbi:MAG: hypothetical protein KBC33_00190 [Candidatus Pacebacteria bacterium]|nr:hypothetical protein [Candidatus Paceibacterota bacterium]
MHPLIWISIVVFILGLLTIGTAFNNATKWQLGKAAGVSEVGVIVVFIGLLLLVICGALKGLKVI